MSPLPSEAIFHSSLVMDKYGESCNFFEQDEQGRTREKILGIKLLESSQLSGAKQQRALKDIGDMSLFICGYFSDSLNRKLVDVKYYQDIGMMAYSRLNAHVHEAYQIPDFYELLSHSFIPLISVMGLVFEQNNFTPDEDSFLLFVGGAGRELKAS